MSDKKLQPVEIQLEERREAISEYLPCHFCGSLDYDLSDGYQNEAGQWVAQACDCCGFGLRNKEAVTWH